MKSIIYLGMDVHTTNYTLCCYTLEDDRMCHLQQIAPDYRLILKIWTRSAVSITTTWNSSVVMRPDASVTASTTS